VCAGQAELVCLPDLCSSLGGGKRAGFGEQLPAMLKTSGNWLRRRGEIGLLFSDPFLLTDPIGELWPVKKQCKEEAGPPPFLL
jgi:hypothetical protein